MNKITSIFLYIRSCLTFILIGPILLLVLFIYPTATYSLIRPFCKLMIYMFGCKINIQGKFPPNQHFVIMANHSSFLDVFAVPCALKGKYSAIAAAKNFKIPIFSTFLKKLKTISIDRSNKHQAIGGINQAEKVLQSGYHIVILPEGTRTTNGKLGKFKKGGFHLAKNTSANILPIITRGLFNIKPKNRWTLKPGLISINIGKPIYTQGKTIDDLIHETENIFLNNL